MVHDILGLLPVKTRPEYNKRREEWIKSLKNRINQKQKWSDEDERIYQSIMDDTVQENQLDDKQINWIKSLRGKIQQQQEPQYNNLSWSEEDEDMVRYIGNAITCKESAKYLEEKGIDMIKVHRWLESYKYQSKEEWSEEDKRHIKELESLVRQVWTIAEHENDKDNMHKMSELSFFLKTFRPQLKQEWSDEDEGFLNLLLAIFTVEHPNGVFSTGNIKPFNENYVTSNRIITWIKSIKDKIQPKPYWKPSEEQLKCLQHYADQNNYDGTVLTSLLNDLKKL